MPKSVVIFISLILYGLTPPTAARQVIGWVEPARVYPAGLEFEAKIDSGAQTTSLHCQSCTVFTRDGQEWLRLQLQDTAGTAVSLERRILRWATIRQHHGEKQLRPVVLLGICLGAIYKEIEVNLIDRHGLKYALLIGRNFLRESFLIDSTRTFTSRPDCSSIQE